MIKQAVSLPVRSNPDQIREMFDAIAPTYDILNHLLSFGLDILWRKKAIKLLREKHRGAILDIAAGSGDLTIEALALQPRVIVASDFSFNMLTVLQQKIDQRNLVQVPLLVSCEAAQLPFKSASFDVTMVAFGIRNFSDRLQSLREMRRVLTPGGISLILELTSPRAPIMKQMYGFYTKVVLPVLGKLISKSNSAYTYLPESISNFSSREEFVSLMEQAGFIEVNSHSLSFGVATIFIGRRDRS